MAKQVRITLGKDGSVKAEALGFKGGACEDATAFLDNLFDGPKKRDLKASYHETEDIQVCNGLPSGWCG